jgi:hypothetical protein
MATIKNTNNKKCWGKGTHIHSWWKCKLVKSLWKNTIDAHQKTKNRTAL